MQQTFTGQVSVTLNVGHGSTTERFAAPISNYRGLTTTDIVQWQGHADTLFLLQRGRPRISKTELVEYILFFLGPGIRDDPDRNRHSHGHEGVFTPHYRCANLPAHTRPSTTADVPTAGFLHFTPR